MTTTEPTVPESCTHCPYIDQFHSTCSHPFRQSIVQELENGQKSCPVFPHVRAEAMRSLEDRLQ